MVVDTEVAREQEQLLVQMEESRESLAHKIELLEGKVTETVESATATVQEATANVLETVQNATASVSETVGNVTTAVQGTVENVRTSLHDGVESVKETFNIQHQVQQHPWLMLFGAVAAGYAGAMYLQKPARGSRRDWERFDRSEFRSGSNQAFEQYGQQSPLYAAPASLRPSVTSESSLNGTTSSAKVETAPAQSSWMSTLSDTLGPELNKLKGLAIGTALGAVRDSVIQSAPEAMKKTLAEVIDDVTEKLGGQCLHGSLFTPDAEPVHSSQTRSVPSMPR